MWSQLPDGSPWLSVCDRIEADLPSSLQSTVMFHLCDAGQPKECLVLDFPQTNLTKAELSTLRTTIGEKYQGQLSFLTQPNNIYVPYFKFPPTLLNTQASVPPTPTTNPFSPSAVVGLVSALPETLSPIAQFNQKYCTPCPNKCTTNETYLRCLATRSFQELQTHTTLLTKLADRPAYKKKGEFSPIER